jgi:hypothetical protein
MAKVIEINCETGETIERDQTAEEIAAQEQAAQEAADRKAAEEKAAAEKATARTALLAKLGLTEEEAALLLN